MKYKNIREEELKNKVGQDFFSDFDTTEIIGNIDFTVFPKKNSLFGKLPLLWAEAKTGDYDLVAMFAQLILTIGKARTFDKILPPAFLGAFDAKKIAFIPYNVMLDIFSLNDFNWNITSSNQSTKEFAIIREKIEKSLDQNKYVYNYLTDEKELQFFIKNNLANATESGKILIDKNNFVPIYLRWLEQVKPCINFDWEAGKKQNILDNSFYLADLFVDDKGTNSMEDDTPISENLFVVFRNGHYEIAKENLKSLFNASIPFRDKKPHEQFWKKYKRPPLEEFQRYILERKDLLVPQDVRERKGAFFTPKIWVELSQKYIADVLGEDWQDEYYVWDCAAGTGNLLAGLTNKYQIFASTLDQSDVNAMHERIENGAILLSDHCFQFDFLNDEFLPISAGGKLPDELYKIITDEEKRKKLVVYINPPYAEATQNYGKNTKKAVEQHKTNEKYAKYLKQANREIFAQFLTRIYFEIDNCILAEFSKLKILSGQHFVDFRVFFKTKLERCFVVPADTFDNVIGSFPIGFKIWNLNIKEKFNNILSDVYDKNENYIGTKKYYAYDNNNYINDWIKPYRSQKNDKFIIGKFPFVGNDFQTQPMVKIVNSETVYIKSAGQFLINNLNIIPTSIYYAVRKCIDATWLNDRDQFLYPNDDWQTDTEFQNDCLAFTLFNTNIQSKYGTNHWIPFTEQQLNAKTKFESNFMTNFISGKIKPEEKPQDLFSTTETLSEFITPKTLKLEFSPEATAVFSAGRELWIYYHSQEFPTFRDGKTITYNVNASLYDIREYFQGRNDKGKMNNKSTDETYMKLISKLRENLKLLAKKIEPKVYEFGFLKV